MSTFGLYIIPRNDLDSLNMPKMAVQVGHACNAFVHAHNKRLKNVVDFPEGVTSKNCPVAFPTPQDEYVEMWQRETIQGFGTTLLMTRTCHHVGRWQSESFDYKLPIDAVTLVNLSNKYHEAGYISDVVSDPTYPVNDGGAMHYVDIMTTMYIFGRRDDEVLRGMMDEDSITLMPANYFDKSEIKR